MANVGVNAVQWNALSDDEKSTITAAFREAKLIGADENLVADPAAPPYQSTSPEFMGWDPLEDLCKKGCDIAATAAAGWCSANTAGVGLVACLAAAEAARKHCRKKC